MEKVIISQAQAKEMEAFKSLGRNLQDWLRGRDNENYPNSVLHELTIDEMARVLYVGYEVEKPKFKAGDKVLWQSPICSDSEFYTLDRETSRPLGPAWCTDGEFVYEKDIRHATPEETYWLETLGREKVGDFKIGDVFMDEDGEVYHVEDRVELIDAVDWYADRDFKGLYPAESFKTFPKDE